MLRTLLLLIIVLVLIMLIYKFRLYKKLEKYSAGPCIVKKNSFGIYSNEEKECILNKECSKDGDCELDDYMCCYSMCRLKTPDGICPMSDIDERCDKNEDCIGYDNNDKNICCSKPGLKYSRCSKSYVDKDNNPKCTKNDINRNRLGETCLVDSDCVDGGIKYNYTKNGYIKCCKGKCTDSKK